MIVDQRCRLDNAPTGGGIPSSGHQAAEVGTAQVGTVCAGKDASGFHERFEASEYHPFAVEGHRVDVPRHIRVAEDFLHAGIADFL